jgi:hypothetical protein
MMPVFKTRLLFVFAGKIFLPVKRMIKQATMYLMNP